MNDFSLTVNGITRQEYIQACRITARRLYVILAVSMAVICGAIILASGDARPVAFLAPLGLYLICVLVCEVYPRINYKGQLETLEEPITYRFNQLNWSVQQGDGETHTFPWEGTPKLKQTRDCVFLFNDGASGNLLPRRLLTEEQINQLHQWYKATRILARDYEAKKLRRERAEFKDSHPGMRLGNRGPSWGPFRRR